MTDPQRRIIATKFGVDPATCGITHKKTVIECEEDHILLTDRLAEAPESTPCGA